MFKIKYWNKYQENKLKYSKLIRYYSNYNLYIDSYFFKKLDKVKYVFSLVVRSYTYFLDMMKVFWCFTLSLLSTSILSKNKWAIFF